MNIRNKKGIEKIIVICMYMYVSSCDAKRKYVHDTAVQLREYKTLNKQCISIT